MLKHKNLFITATLVIIALLAGCSQSDESSTNNTGETVVIDGYILPSDPGEAGKATLLGIDSNDNGVRDDVEIYIYKRFQGFENAKKDRAIAMQYAKATQIIMQNPETAYEKKTYVVMNNVIDCAWYYYETSGTSFESIMAFRNKHLIFDPAMKDVIFNTRDRLEAYMQYNDSLSGHVFDSRPRVIEKCEVDIDALGNE